MDDISDIREFYDRALDEEERLTRHQLEWDITWRYLERYLPSEGRLLELGAATGRYTREMARRGYHVTAVDLSPQLTEVAKSKCRELGVEGRVEHIVADARDLACLEDRCFDAALIMGPLYHLIFEQDRRLVLRQVHTLLEPAGVIVSSFICRLGVWADQMREFPWLVTQVAAEVESVLSRGHDTPEEHRGGFRGYYARVEEIAPLHESEGYETLVVAAAEPAIGADDETYNHLEGQERAAWMDLLYRLSAEPSVIGASRHLLYVGRKSSTL